MEELLLSLNQSKETKVHSNNQKENKVSVEGVAIARQQAYSALNLKESICYFQ